MKININKIETIEMALNQVQSRAKKRLLEISEIEQACHNAETKLTDIGIPKKAWIGCRIEILPEKVCNAYAKKGKAEGTYCKIERLSSGWFVVGMDRRQCRTCPNGASPEVRLTLGDPAIEAMPKTFTI